MAVIPDRLIHEWAKQGGIEPYNPVRVNPASIDVCWSGRVRVCRPEAINTVLDYRAFLDKGQREQLIDQLFYPMQDVDRFVFEPGCFYLMDTLEYIYMPSEWCGVLMLKSTSARLAMEHLHAGFIDPGYEGTVTLEMVFFGWRMRIYRGDPLAQIELARMVEKPNRAYDRTGRYQGSRVPTIARPPISTVQ